MAIAVLSLIVPLIKIQWQQPIEVDSTMYYLLTSVASNNTEIDINLQSKWYNLNWQALLTVVYATVSLILLTGMVTALIRIYRLLKNNSCKSLGEVFVILTNANGTPFSFFSYIFWNDAIDLKSESGKQILQHELTHVKQKHSIDKLLIQLVLIVGWFNPFFWLIKKEMDMIHEFIADQHTIENGDAASLAEMLLTAVYPQQQYLLVNPFFFSPIKRRIQMIKNNSTPKYSYMRRLVILPLLAILVVLFAFRNKENTKPISMGTLIENIADVVKEQKEKYTGKIQLKEIGLKQSYTIVINPGHGGKDRGAIGVDLKTTEAELTLSLAKVIKEINTNEKIDIVLTRDNDVYQSVVDVSNFANQQKADLFVSLHYNTASPVKQSGKPSKENPANGAEIYIYPNSAINENNYLLANSIANKINQLEIPFNGIKTRKEGIYVLKNATFPSVLLEAGYLSNTKDLKIIKESNYEKDLAVSILNGIQQYLFLKENITKVKDTIILNSDSVYVVPVDKKITIISPNGTSSFSGNSKADFTKEKNEKFGVAGSVNAVYYLDGNKVDYSIINEINPSAIKSVNVLKGSSAVALYGDEGKNGVVEINSKKDNQSEARKIPLSITVRKRIDDSSKANPLYIVDGKILPQSAVNSISPNTIKSMNVVKGENAVKMYGSAAKDGIIEITSKNLDIKQGFPLIEDKPRVTVVGKKINGVVDESATNINNNKIVVEKNSSASKDINNFIKKHPDISGIEWRHSPLRMSVKFNDGSEESYDFTNTESKKRAEKKYGIIPVPPPPPPPSSSKIVEVKPLNNEVQYDKVFTVAQVPASFPGGKDAWQKYLDRNLNRDIPVNKGAPAGKYVTTIEFIVELDGTLADIKIATNPGYGTGEEALRIIANGPRWVPASQNGKIVISKVKQNITFQISED